MNGDLGNLLTGELGEAEARFSHKDFAGDYGRRVMGRVRRRRTVRAAGVGGGTMLTAGALALGATHIPWGVWGAAPGVGGSDCVTPSPSIGHLRYTVTPTESEQIRATTNYEMPIDLGPDVAQGWTQFTPETGLPQLIVVHTHDGAWLVTIGSGDAQQVEPDETGTVTIDLVAGSKTTTYRLVSTLGNLSVAETTTAVVGQPTPATDDCYTPSPTPSGDPNMANGISQVPDPSLAAKPEDVIGDSPFECGFTFPTDSYSTYTQSIDGLEWISPDEINALINDLPPGFGLDGAQATGQGDVLLVAVRDTFGLPFSDWVRGGGEAIDPMAMLGESDPYAPASGVSTAHGSSFVAVADGIVVGTIAEPSVPDTAPPVYRWRHGADFDESLVLLNPDGAFTACPGATLDGDWDLYAVAGDVARESDGRMHGPDYFWLKVGNS